MRMKVLRQLLILLLLTGSVGLACAQPADSAAVKTRLLAVAALGTVFPDDNGELTEQLLAAEWQRPEAFQHFRRSQVYAFRLEIFSSADAPINAWFLPPPVNLNVVGQPGAWVWGGYDRAQKQLRTLYDKEAVPLTLKPGKQTVTIVVLGLRGKQFWHQVLLQPGYERWHARQLTRTHTENYAAVFMLGIMVFALLFYLFLYLQSRQPMFGWYAAYGFCVALYTAIGLDQVTWLGTAFAHHPHAWLTLQEGLQMAGAALYIAFGSALLQLPAEMPVLYRWLRRMQWVLLVYGGWFTISYAWYGWAFVHIAEILLYSRIFLLLSIGLVMALLFHRRRQNKVAQWFLAGSAVYLISAVAGAFINAGWIQLPGAWANLTAANVFQAGIGTEMLLFGMAMGLRIQQEHRQSLAQKNELIQVMQQNQQLSAEVQEKVELLLAQKTLLVQQQEKDLLVADLLQQKLALRLQLVRYQINPHFIFNCLNGMKGLIQQRQDEQAIRYLIKFSQFLRQVLERSQVASVSLADELAFIQLYVQLEAIRLGAAFHYHVDHPPAGFWSQLPVPPLLLQPLVENAIWHGLMPAPTDQKMLQLRFVLETDDVLTLLLEDNGVGYRPSATAAQAHKSMGMHMVSELLLLHNASETEATISMHIQQLQPEDVLPGTQVNLTFCKTNQSSL